MKDIRQQDIGKIGSREGKQGAKCLKRAWRGRWGYSIPFSHPQQLNILKLTFHAHPSAWGGHPTFAPWIGAEPKIRMCSSGVGAGEAIPCLPHLGGVAGHQFPATKAEGFETTKARPGSPLFFRAPGQERIQPAKGYRKMVRALRV